MNEQEKNQPATTDIHFPSKLNIRLDWSEMDMFGHINNVMFFKFMQASRVNYWEMSKFHEDYLTKKLAHYLYPLLASSANHYFIRVIFQ